MRVNDKIGESATIFSRELRRSWMLRTSLTLVVLGGLAFCLFNIGVGGMIVLAGFLVYLYYRDRKQTRFL